MAVRVSYHLRLSYMSLIENSLSYIWKYFTILPYFIQGLCDNLFNFRMKFLIKMPSHHFFRDEMTSFSPFIQFVTVFIPALTGNSSISVTAHLVFVHSVSRPKGITYIRSVPKMSGNR